MVVEKRSGRRDPIAETRLVERKLDVVGSPIVSTRADGNERHDQLELERGNKRTKTKRQKQRNSFLSARRFDDALSFWTDCLGFVFFRRSFAKWHPFYEYKLEIGGADVFFAAAIRFPIIQKHLRLATGHSICFSTFSEQKKRHRFPRSARSAAAAINPKNGQ